MLVFEAYPSLLIPICIISLALQSFTLRLLSFSIIPSLISEPFSVIFSSTSSSLHSITPLKPFSCLAWAEAAISSSISSRSSLLSVSAILD